MTNSGLLPDRRRIEDPDAQLAGRQARLYGPLAPLAWELFGALAEDDKRKAWITAQGVDWLNLMPGPARWLGTARGVIGPSGHWEFDEGGRWHLVLPVLCHYSGQIEDLVAWQPRFPGRFANWRGFSDLLGDPEPDWLAEWHERPPIALHRTPWDWLLAGCDGIAPATADRRAFRNALFRCPKLLCRDVDHGREIQRLLTDALPELPQVLVPRAAIEAAA